MSLENEEEWISLKGYVHNSEALNDLHWTCVCTKYRDATWHQHIKFASTKDENHKACIARGPPYYCAGPNLIGPAPNIPLTDSALSKHVIQDERPVPLPPPPWSPPVQHPLQHCSQVDGLGCPPPHLRRTGVFMMIQAASLGDPVNKMSTEGVQCLRNPPQAPIDLESSGVCLSISMYLTLEHSSQDAYEQIQWSIQLNLSDSPTTEDILSFHALENKIASYTGVEYIETNMCPESCVGFTGPFTGLESCPIASCGASRWDPGCLHASNGHVKVTAKKFTTIPLSPQLQAQYCDPQSACAM
ncbi:hypothetical protein BDN67DRAFT_992062 [Paxillus ammoniavirescens]|nr:hypothetical protein BDN67DRAFT_992062 [Paxillus ammoniavirescens]